jgi:hypothetical protein
MSTLQETPTPALVIHRYGLRKFCVLPAGVEPDDAHGKYLCIGTRKQCEGYVNERQALAEARAAAQLQQPNGQVPAADPENYAARVRQAYQQLAGERRNPDVPIVDLYQRVGGELAPFHRFLEQEAYEGRAVPTTGEPTLASGEAQLPALVLRGELDRVSGQPLRFFNVKLFEALAPAKDVTPSPVVTPEPLADPPLQYAVTLTGPELELLRQSLDDQARTIAASKAPDQARLQAATDLSAKLEGLQPQREQAPPQAGPREPELAERKPEVTPVKQELGPDPNPPDVVEEYRRELVERARAKYPDATPELAARIDKEVQRRVNIVKTYQDHLLQAQREHFPKATPEEKAQHLANIRQEVKDFAQAQEAHLQQERENRQQQREQAQHQPPPSVRARAQQQHLGYSR